MIGGFIDTVLNVQKEMSFAVSKWVQEMFQQPSMQQFSPSNKQLKLQNMREKSRKRYSEESGHRLNVRSTKRSRECETKSQAV